MSSIPGTGAQQKGWGAACLKGTESPKLGRASKSSLGGYALWTRESRPMGDGQTGALESAGPEFKSQHWGLFAGCNFKNCDSLNNGPQRQSYTNPQNTLPHEVKET